jgi:hypothetical protein
MCHEEKVTTMLAELRDWQICKNQTEMQQYYWRAEKDIYASQCQEKAGTPGMP